MKQHAKSLVVFLSIILFSGFLQVQAETIQLGGDSTVRTAGWLELTGESGTNNVQPISYTDTNGITFTVTATANAGQSVTVLNYGLAVMGGATDSRIDGSESLELTLSVSGGNLSDLSASFLVGSLGTGEGFDVTDGASTAVIAELASDLVEYGAGNGLDGLAPLSTAGISTWSIKFSPNAAYPNTKAILNALILDYTVNTNPPPYYPLYAEAAQLYSNSAPYDLGSETYTFSEVFRTPCYPDGGTVNEDHGTPIVSYGDSTFVVYADAGRRIKIAKITDGTVEEAYLDNTLYQAADFYANQDADPDNDMVAPDYYRMKAADSHHDFCIGVDKYGYIHIAGDMHNFPAVNTAHLPTRYAGSHCLYWRSDNPGDISSFSFKGDDPTTCPQGYGITYLEFQKDLEGELFFTSRVYQGAPDAEARRAQATSRYDAENGTWSIVGGKAFEPDGYEVTFWEDNAENGGSYVKMFADMSFDRQNRMHLATGMLNYDAPAAVPVYAVLTDLLYLQSTDGGATMKKTDGSVVSMPARVEAGTNQAEIIYTTDYLTDPNNAEYLNAKVQVGHDISDNPYVLCKPKVTDGLTATSLPTKLFGWSSGGGWIDYGDVVPAYEYLFTDPAGVMTAINGADVYRFWAPGSVKTIATGWGGQLRGYDREYIKKTGNIQLIYQDMDTDELVVTRMEIARPGMQLVTPPAETATNQPPEITSAASFDGTSLSVAATDADGDPLTYTWSVEYSSATGTVTFSENGTAAAANTVPQFPEDGTYILKVEISDGSSIRTASVSFYATINAAPSWNADPFDSSTATEDAAYTKFLDWRVTDPDNDPLQFALVSGPNWLSMANSSNGKIAGTPTQADVGINTFTVSVSDGVNPAVEATMHIVVNNVNDAPVALDYSTNTFEDVSIALTLAGSDVDSANLAYTVLTDPANGTYDTNGIYIPDPNFFGTNSIVFEVSDGALTDTGTVTIAVNPVNDAPVAFGYSTNLLEDTSLAVVLSGSDIDSASLVYTILTDPANGTYDTNGIFIPDPNFFGTNSIVFEVSDGALTDIGTVSIVVDPVNDAPVANSGSATVAEDGSVVVVLTGSDIDGDGLAYNVVSGPSHGSYVGGTYTPHANYNGSDSFTFVANDGTVDSAPATVTITVNAVNDAPVFGADPIAGADATVGEAYSGAVAATDIDSASLAYSKASGPAWLAVAADGSLGGVPSGTDVGLNSFIVAVDDGSGGTDSATLEISVLAASGGATAPGLWYGTVAGNINTTDPNPESSVTVDLAETEDDIAVSTTEIYTGEIYDADGNISFTEDIDDKTRLYIDGVLVLSSDSWRDRTSTGNLDLSPGWHMFELRISNGGGPGGKHTAPGFGFDPDGGTSWIHPADPGDGSLFRHATGIAPTLPAYGFALAETNWFGSVSGSLADTDTSSSNVYEVLTEALDGSPTSLADHEWEFNVYGAELVTFYLEAHHSANTEGDDFVFAYSTNETDWTEMLTVTKTADDNTLQWYALPSGLSGTVYVRAVDTDRTAGNNGLDSLYVDAVLIVSSDSTAAPLAANTPQPADGATDVPVDQVLAWISGAQSSTNAVYFGTDPSPAYQGQVLGHGFDPGTLAADTTYYWAVDSLNAQGSAAGAVWSFTTAPPPAPLGEVALQADVANSTPSAYGGSVANTINDPFAYDPDYPEAALPKQSWGSSDGFHGNEAEGADIVLAYPLANGSLSLAGGQSLAVDLYGRNKLNERCQDIDIQLYSGGTLVYSITGAAIPETAPYHARILLAPGTAFDTVVVVGHDSTVGDNKNVFTLMEIRAAVVQ